MAKLQAKWLIVSYSPSIVTDRLLIMYDMIMSHAATSFSLL